MGGLSDEVHPVDRVELVKRVLNIRKKNRQRKMFPKLEATNSFISFDLTHTIF